MSVYINMEMPKNGSCIQIVIDDDGKVYPSVEKCILKMGSIAKAVPVPEHGRLIDADELKERLEYVASLEWNQRVGASPGIECAIDMLDDAQTIIPAEEGE